MFKPKSMQAICVREFQALANDKHKRPSTFIEICFKYEGLPESKDSSQLKTVQPQEEEAVDEGNGSEDVLTSLTERDTKGGNEGGEAEIKNDPEVTMEEFEDLGENIEVEGDGKGVEGEGEALMEGKAVMESEEEGQVEEEEETPRPDQFDLAKLFAGPNDFKDVGPFRFSLC